MWLFIWIYLICAPARVSIFGCGISLENWASQLLTIVDCKLKLFILSSRGIKLLHFFPTSSRPCGSSWPIRVLFDFFPWSNVWVLPCGRRSWRRCSRRRRWCLRRWVRRRRGPQLRRRYGGFPGRLFRSRLRSWDPGRTVWGEGYEEDGGEGWEPEAVYLTWVGGYVQQVAINLYRMNYQY